MADEAAAPAVPEPVQVDAPATAPAREQLKAEEPAADDAPPEPAVSPAEAKAKPKPKLTAKKADAPVVTPVSGSRQRRKVERFKPEAAPEAKKLTVQEVRDCCMVACCALKTTIKIKTSNNLNCGCCRAPARSCATSPTVSHMTHGGWPLMHANRVQMLCKLSHPSAAASKFMSTCAI